MQQEEIEIQLWEFIDGNCTAEEQAHISGLIATDAKWKACYEDLLSFHRSVQANVQPRQTAPGFTENVMTALDASASRYAARKRMLTLSIRVIAAFFILSIVLLLSYALIDAGGLSFSPSEYRLPEIHMPEVRLPSYSPFIAGLVAVIILLAAVDKLLRNRSAA